MALTGTSETCAPVSAPDLVIVLHVLNGSGDFLPVSLQQVGSIMFSFERVYVSFRNYRKENVGNNAVMHRMGTFAARCCIHACDSMLKCSDELVDTLLGVK